MGKARSLRIGPAQADRSRIRIAAAVAALGLALFGRSALAEALPEGDRGIGARHPGDVGIARDPAVLFAEDFEQRSLEQVLARWEDAQAAAAMALSDDVPARSRGRRSLQLHKRPGDGARTIGLYRRILRENGKGYPQLYARMYVKFGAKSDPLHHFGATLGGNQPSTPWPQVDAGKRPPGDGSFWSGLEPYAESWRWDFYTYWMEMRSSENEDGSGSGAYGNAFLREGASRGWVAAGPEVRRGEWVCVETMVKVNDPITARNGEQAFWIDGKLVRKDGQIVSHLGPGFPRGSWLRDKWTPDPKGAPFEGFRWRSAPELLANFVWLYLYTERDGYDIPVAFDDLVVATSYIGPIAAGE